MKIRLGLLVVLFLTLTALVMRNNERVLDAVYSFLNPIKQYYIALTDKIESEGESYLMQKKTIDALRQENLRLRQKLLEQKSHIEQLKNVYAIIPQLRRYAPNIVTPVHTISYVKLHTFSRILLTTPDDVRRDTIYGLIENDTVVGIAKLTHNQLYGYLLSDPKCRFAVYVGQDRAPGIAEGAGANRMIVRYIPKWYPIQPGDAVVTSGLDRIFPSSFPVGTVTKVQTQSAYKIATIRTLADLDHPKILFLIRDTNQTLLRRIDYDRLNPIENNQTFDTNDTVTRKETNTTVTNTNATSLPDQTAEVQHEPESLLVSTSGTHTTVTIPKKSTSSRYLPSSGTPSDTSNIPSATHQHADSDIDSIIQTRDDLIQPEPPIENKPPKPQHKVHRKKHRKRTQPSAAPLDLF